MLKKTIFRITLISFLDLSHVAFLILETLQVFLFLFLWHELQHLPNKPRHLESELESLCFPFLHTPGEMFWDVYTWDVWYFSFSLQNYRKELLP